MAHRSDSTFASLSVISIKWASILLWSDSSVRVSPPAAVATSSKQLMQGGFLTYMQRHCLRVCLYVGFTAFAVTVFLSAGSCISSTSSGAGFGVSDSGGQIRGGLQVHFFSAQASQALAFFFSAG